MTSSKPVTLPEDIQPLLAPWEKDPWGIPRPPVNEAVLERSVLLAASAYDLAAEPWTAAGWQDVTAMVDGELTPLNMVTERGHKRLSRLRDKLHGMNPLMQMMGTVMNMGESGTCKAMIMAHPPVEGKVLIAISFMGTGERVFDWISNFRMMAEDGMHQGFLELCRQVEEKEKDITFPGLAKSLGMEKLTLHDVLQDMHRPESPFELWMCGHSQGGAVMQVYTFRKMREGVLPAHMRGYGFASPTVMVGDRVADPSAYPLWHVINEDDIVPRVGAQVHLGVVLSFRPDSAFRKEVYRWREDETAQTSRKAVWRILRHIRDTGSSLTISLAYAQALGDRNAADFFTGVGSLGLFQGVFQRVMTAADNRVDAMVRFFTRHCAKRYESILGVPMDMDEVEKWRGVIHYQLSRLGVKPFGEALAELLHFSHSIGSLENDQGAYQVIVRRGMGCLRPGVWLAGRPPRLHYGLERADAAHALRAVRSPQRVRRQRMERGRRNGRIRR